MQPLMDVVPGVEITAQHALEVLPDQLLDHFATARMVVFVIADVRSGNASNIAVEAIFSPSGFIGLHRRAGSDPRFETARDGLRMLPDAMQQFARVAATALMAVKITH